MISHVPDLLQIARPFIRPPMILPVLPWLIGVDGQNRAFRQIVYGLRLMESLRIFRTQEHG